MARLPQLKYQGGTLTLHPPPPGKGWQDYATWDDRIEQYRLQAIDYRPLVESLWQSQTEFIDHAKLFIDLDLQMTAIKEPYLHQKEALTAWKQAGRRGVVVLPTAAGKTYLAHLIMQSTPRSTLIVVPTLDLMHQWYTQTKTLFPNIEVGLLGGGSHDRTPILIATYKSAAIHTTGLGNLYGLVIFDECHHLPTEFYRVIAECSIAPYRLGLSATPERVDGSHQDLDRLIGSVVYRKTPAELANQPLAPYEIVQIKVQLSELEKKRYQQAIETRNNFLQKSHISLGGLEGWQLFVKRSAVSSEGRRAMLAHREAKEIALGTQGKLDTLAELIERHWPEPMLIFTNDNATVYKISSEFLIPAITHQTPVKERHEVLKLFREGQYKTLVTSHVLNEGVDVPDVAIAVILSGTGSPREYIQRLGRILRKGSKPNKTAILYEVIAQETSEESTAKRRQTPLVYGSKETSLKVAESTDDYLT